MSILVSLQHVTRYRYDRPVALGPQIVRLRPAPHCRTAIRELFAQGHAGRAFRELAAGPERQLAGALRLSGADHRVHRHGRSCSPTCRSSIRSTSSSIRSATNYPFVYPSEFDEELAPYLVKEAGRVRCLRNFSHRSRATPQNIVDFLVALNQRLQRDIRYLVRMEPGVQTPEETLQLASGSCRDTAWLLVQILRHLGLAARFVSGYLIQLMPDLKALDGPAGATAGLHRSARLGRGLSAGRRLDRARSDLRPAVRRGPSAARRDAALSAPPRRSPAASSRPRSTSRSR